MSDNYEIKSEETKISDLESKIETIELFPGTLEEYERLKGANYEIIDVPGNKKFLCGSITSLKHISKKRVIIDTLKFLVGLSLRNENTEYREIVIRAAELDADAIIRYQIVNNTVIGYSEMGIPVRKSSKRV